MILTIVIPVYKVEKYIDKCLSSIYATSCHEDVFEIIVVNDGTPDDSMTIVSKHADKHTNLRIINQKNQGLSRSRNVGIENAKGDYIWFVDSDDWVENGFLSKLISLLSISDKDVLMIKLREISEDTGDCLKVTIFGMKTQLNFVRDVI